MKCGARGDGLKDDSRAINDCIGSGVHTYLPCGTYRLESPLQIKDKAHVRLSGAGDCSALTPAPGMIRNTLDVSGTTDLEIDHLLWDGVNIRGLTSVALSAIIGDGSKSHPTYGPVRIHNNRVTHWEQQGFGLGANGESTATDIRIDHNIFWMAGGVISGNAIDFGGSGIHRRVAAFANIITWSSQPQRTTNGCVGIFTGHGNTVDAAITGNEVESACDVGIVAFSRPYSRESTSYRNSQITGNTVRFPRGTGIAAYGTANTRIESNKVFNPGVGPAGTSPHVCIFVSHGASGTDELYPSTMLTVSRNLCEDTAHPPTMNYGIEFSTARGYGTTSRPGFNTIKGFRISKYVTLP